MNEQVFSSSAFDVRFVKLLNTIDCHLDQELASKFDLNLTWFEVFPLTKRRFVAAPLVMSTPSQEQWKRFLNTVEVVPAPSYLVSISVALAQLLPVYLHPIKVSKKIMKSSFHQLGFTEFVKGITAISGIFKRNDVDYFFPKPFSIKPIRLTARDKVIQFVRFQITKQVLFPRRASD